MQKEDRNEVLYRVRGLRNRQSPIQKEETKKAQEVLFQFCTTNVARLERFEDGNKC